MTVGETWIHRFTPETKEQSKLWTTPCESVPRESENYAIGRKGDDYANY